jgi:hypothetical protein
MLNQLIRKSREESPEDLRRPSVEAITAYLMGEATAGQRNEVRAAMLKSAAFRQEILDMANDMEMLGDADSSLLTEAEVGAKVPSRREFLRAHGERAGQEHRPEPVWMRLKRWGRMRVYAPVAVAAAVLLRIVVWPALVGPPPVEVPILAQWVVVQERVETGHLRLNTTRSVDVPSAVWPEASEAALAEFRMLLEYKDDGFTLRPRDRRREPPSPFSTVSLVLLGSDDRVLGRFGVKIPGARAAGEPRPEAWLLSMPAQRLFRLKVVADTLATRVPAGMEPTGCVTFTYLTDEGYKATDGFAFER